MGYTFPKRETPADIIPWLTPNFTPWHTLLQTAAQTVLLFK